MQLSLLTSLPLLSLPPACAQCCRLPLSLLLYAAAGAPSWYSCICAAGAPNCVCPSTAPPGGLDPQTVPQLILFTHDDAITQKTYEAFTGILEGRRSADGCPAAATMMVTNKYTDCALLRQLHAAGNEIAGHTYSHAQVGEEEKGWPVGRCCVCRCVAWGEMRR